MRIIAGRHRGRTILGPESENTRPITDRAKQSLFDILAPRVEGADVYDLFAGTGSMGLESLSRGAAKATFFERDKSALIRLRKNLASLREQATVIDKDVFRWFPPPPPQGDVGESAKKVLITQQLDMIFLDPPYTFVREKAAELRSLTHSLAVYYLNTDGILIFRHDRSDTLDLPGLTVIDQRTYGSMAIDILQPAAAPADGIHT
jgi:16S rRNA (guanine966-N2)-methyltransferase